MPDNSLCGVGEVCNTELGCVSVSNCDSCASNQKCCNGKCQDCCTPEDCTAVIGTDYAIIPPPGGGSCAANRCEEGKCIYETQYCSGEQVCCTPYGCHAFGCPI